MRSTARVFAAIAFSGSRSQTSTLWNAAQLMTTSKCAAASSVAGSSVTRSNSACAGAVISASVSSLRNAVPTCPEPPISRIRFTPRRFARLPTPTPDAMAIQVRETTLADARIFVPDVYEDDRGFFKETYSTSKYRALGLTDDFVQDSVSFSSKNVIRGLHGDPEMSKLITILRGKIWDVIVDVRKGSPTYCKWQGFILSEHNHVQLYIPKGF